jgi:hypothetical protein
MASRRQFVVARHRPELMDFYKHWFTPEEATGDIELILDGRLRERRERGEPREPDMRRCERRRQSSAHDLDTVGWALRDPS